MDGEKKESRNRHTLYCQFILTKLTRCLKEETIFNINIDPYTHIINIKLTQMDHRLKYKS